MELARPDLVPGPNMDREAMVAQQAAVRDAARFRTAPAATDRLLDPSEPAGVDQAFADDAVVSAAVTLRDGDVADATVARSPIRVPYIPGLLAFREAEAVVAACTELDGTPDVLFVDGNGRLHPRAAGLATHVGVILDVPTVGIAKSQLCGELVGPATPPFGAGARMPIVATDAEAIPAGTVLGYAVQTRQWVRPGNAINPIYVSPGHRTDAETAALAALAVCDGYKLPEPIRAADKHAGDASA